MKTFELIAPCHFGMEAVLKREIYDLGYEISKVENGKVTFIGDEQAVADANVFLRTTERILLKVGEFKATSFEELFQGTINIPWENYIPEDGKFWVTKATSVNSKVFSPSDIQSIMKKAMVKRMENHYKKDWFSEEGASYPVRVSIMKDIVTVSLDTTGTSLHKRGYRTNTVKAPITETLAAAILMLTPWKRDRILVDPFCGSGTFLIEAAMIACNIAPGLNRNFTFTSWHNLIPRDCIREAKEMARENIDMDIELNLQGYDIDDFALSCARENAKNAGVEKFIHFQNRDVKDLSHKKPYGFIVTNPPYGERLEDKEALYGIYKALGEAYKNLDKWSMYMITSYENAPKDMGLVPTKNRKIYNGMLKTYLYQFIGPKPPRKEK